MSKRIQSRTSAIAVSILFAGTAFAASTQSGTSTVLVSRSDSGGQPSLESRRARLSGDGRYVAFECLAHDVVAGDTNNSYDIFVRDLAAGTTERVSVASSGMEANGHSRTPSISGDGRLVAFESAATNLVTFDLNGVEDIFVHDRVSKTTIRVSVSSTGAESTGRSVLPAISSDGSVVAFGSRARQPGQPLSGNGIRLGLRPTTSRTGATELVSQSSTGVLETWRARSVKSPLTVGSCLGEQGGGAGTAGARAGLGRVCTRPPSEHHGPREPRQLWTTRLRGQPAADDLGRWQIRRVPEQGRRPDRRGHEWRRGRLRPRHGRGHHDASQRRLQRSAGHGLQRQPVHVGRRALDRVHERGPEPDRERLQLGVGRVHARHARGRDVPPVRRLGRGRGRRPQREPLDRPARRARRVREHGGHLVPGDTNGAKDVFLRHWGTVTTPYCTGKTNSIGCTPAIEAAGVASASATAGFVLTAQPVINNKAGLFFYSVGGSQAGVPFQCGTLCVGPSGIRRTPVQTSGGQPPPWVDCSGVFTFDMNAFASGLSGGNPSPALQVAGTLVHAQAWGRDQGFNPPCNTTLSNGLEYAIGP